MCIYIVIVDELSSEAKAGSFNRSQIIFSLEDVFFRIFRDSEVAWSANFLIDLHEH